MVGESVFWGALALCGVCDVRSFRVPNRLLAVCFLAGLWQAARAGTAFDPGGAAAYLVRAGLTALVFFPFCVLKMTGAGDGKTAAVIVGRLGFMAGAEALAAGFVLGAVLALGRLLRDGSAYSRFRYLYAYIGQMISQKKKIPYYDRERYGRGCVIPLGACLCAGAALTAAGFL